MSDHRTSENTAQSAVSRHGPEDAIPDPALREGVRQVLKEFPDDDGAWIGEMIPPSPPQVRASAVRRGTRFQRWLHGDAAELVARSTNAEPSRWRETYERATEATAVRVSWWKMRMLTIRWRVRQVCRAAWRHPVALGVVIGMLATIMIHRTTRRVAVTSAPMVGPVAGRIDATYDRFTDYTTRTLVLPIHQPQRIRDRVTEQDGQAQATLVFTARTKGKTGYLLREPKDRATIGNRNDKGTLSAYFIEGVQIDLVIKTTGMLAMGSGRDILDFPSVFQPDRLAGQPLTARCDAIEFLADENRFRETAMVVGYETLPSTDDLQHLGVANEVALRGCDMDITLSISERNGLRAYVQSFLMPVTKRVASSGT